MPKRQAPTGWAALCRKDGTSSSAPPSRLPLAERLPPSRRGCYNSVAATQVAALVCARLGRVDKNVGTGVARMYAILETGGKQYKVEPGDVIEVERLDGEVGSRVELGNILLMITDDGPTFGSPVLNGARVVAEVVEQGKGDKITVLKYKRKVRYRRKTGHRQTVTRLRITDILGGAGGSSSRKATGVEEEDGA